MKIYDFNQMSTKPSIQIGGFHTLSKIERAHIEQVVANCGTLSEAADALGINAATLYRKRKRWGQVVLQKCAVDGCGTLMSLGSPKKCPDHQASDVAVLIAGTKP